MNQPFFESYYEPKTSFEDFLNIRELPKNQNRTLELIDGFVYMMAGNTSSNHQRISGYIARKIGNYLDGKKCEVFQDLNVYLYKDDINECENVFQPDILVGCDKEKMTDKGYEGTPEFIVEVVSKSTAQRDYFLKYKFYMDFGVKEYWIVDLFKEHVIVYINCGENPPDLYKYSFNDEVNIGVFGDLSIDFKEILKIVDSGRY